MSFGTSDIFAAASHCGVALTCQPVVYRFIRNTSPKKKVELLFTNISLSGRVFLSELCQGFPVMWCSQLGEAVLLSEEACENRSLLSDAVVFMPRLTLTNKQSTDSCTDCT